MEDITNELLKALPMQPRPEVEEWIRNNKRFRKDYIAYRVAYVPSLGYGEKEKMVECRCTACTGTFFQAYYKKGAEIGFYDDDFQPIESGNVCLCPNCGAEVTAYHISKLRTTKSGFYAWPCEFTRVLGNPALIQWRAYSAVDKEGTKKFNIAPYEAYVFANRKTYAFKCWYQYFSSFHMLDEYEPRGFRDTMGSTDKDDLYPVSKTEFDGTNLENAKIYEFLRDSRQDSCYLLEYIRTYLRHKQIENLITAGMSKIVNDLIYANSNPYYGYLKTITKGIEWKEKRPAQMLGMNKTEYAVVRREKWDLDTMETYKDMRSGGYPVAPEEFLKFSRKINKHEVDIFISYGVSPIRAYHYILNQQKRYGKNGHDARILLDYYFYAKKANYDLKNDGVAFPKDMKREHDRLMKEEEQRRTREEIEKKKKQIAERKPDFVRLAALYAPFSFANGSLSIRIAASEEELIAEGKALCHCVATYAGSHAKGGSCIFFIRKTSAPDDSFFTLELDMQTLSVLQNRGKQNCARTPEVEAFEEEWLEYIKSLRIRKAG